MATALKIYFRKIYFLNGEKVPEDQPLIIAANHPMAFCDACLLACFLDRPLHFLVRGDVFVKRWLWFFKWTNQIPIYRFRDGFGNMRRNAESFTQVHQELKKEAAVLIFAEGNTKLRKHLAPLQKGPARIALGALEEGAEGLQILPIGINYTDGRTFRSDVFLSVGDPLSLDWRPDQMVSKKTWIDQLTSRIQEALYPHVIHCDTEALEAVHHEKSLKQDIGCRWPIVDKDAARFDYEKMLAEHLNQGKEMSAMEAATKDANQRSSGIRKSLAVMLLPLGIVGIALNAPPFYLAKGIAGAKVRIIEFYTPVRIGLTMILESIWLLILLTLGWIVLGSAALLLVLLIPLLGYLGIVLVEETKRPS